jgi:2-polyprenyl-3-methyl-5-hydroxy-6-metoxy-1,4-benzoquinol methylase
VLTERSKYVMADVDAATESGRLQLLESCRDPGTIGRLRRLGVAGGWRCLEVGAGRGSIARWLAEQVAPTGSVVAVDIDPRFLTDMPENVEVRALDIREDEVEEGTYDLVHCRALLMHLPDPAGTLSRLAAAVRPGGLLLAEEGDYGLYHYGGHPDAEELTQQAHRALDAATAAGVVNTRFGRALPAMLSASGLELRGSEIETIVTTPGEPQYEFARMSALESLPALVAAGVVEEASVERLEGYFGQPGTVITSASVVAAWGQRPA